MNTLVRICNTWLTSKITALISDAAVLRWKNPAGACSRRSNICMRIFSSTRFEIRFSR
ncbi:hypothetical protein D3C81_1894160 [compost metagenome]